jgi:hypothetical protein
MTNGNGIEGMNNHYHERFQSQAAIILGFAKTPD